MVSGVFCQSQNVFNVSVSLCRRFLQSSPLITFGEFPRVVHDPLIHTYGTTVVYGR